MPTITFNLRDLSKLVGKKISPKEIEDLLQYAKAELEEYDKETEDVRADFGDTNLPFLWSVEGLARLLKGILGVQGGVPKLNVKRGNYNLVVENSVTKVRPYIAAFVAKDYKIDNYLIKQIIQLQEKICETYGRKRKKIAVGVYDYSKINFPVKYKAVKPTKIKFIPLDFRKEMNLMDILKDHPKGVEYAHILEDFDKYPILIDDEGSVLSFPPIINSSETGTIKEGDSEIFVEVTGTDLDAVLVSCNIFAQSFFDRGFKIHSVNVKYPSKKIVTPLITNDTIKLNSSDVQDVLGLNLKESEIKTLLKKQRYDYIAGKAIIPCYRKDILHKVDVIEDIAIAYGYDNIPEAPLQSYTSGSGKKITNFVDRTRDIMVGLGYFEVFNQILCNKNLLYNKMEINDFGTVEIQNPTSENYAVVRAWLIPLLMEFLSKNKHVVYPQNIFEQGLVTVRKDGKIFDYERLSAALISEKADYTKIKQVLDCLLSTLGIEYEIEETNHNSFIKGRVGRIFVNKQAVGYIGEIAPRVIYNFSLEMPVVALELNLTEIHNSVK